MDEKINILENLRNQIDNNDNEILLLIKRRLQTSKKIAEYKIKNDLEIFQPGREQEIINKLISKSTTMNINSRFVTKIFDEIFEESKKIQQEVFNKNKQK